MKITNVLSKLITEDAKYQFLNKKYILPSGGRSKGILPFDIVKQIIFADPTTRLPNDFDKEGASTNDMGNVKVGKYSEWMIMQFIKPSLKDEETGEPIEVGSDEYKIQAKEFRRLFLEDLPRFTDLLIKYERFKGSLVDSVKKDINKVSSFDELSKLPVKVGDDTVELELYRGKKVKKQEGVESKTNFNFPGSEILQVGKNFTLIKISDKGDLGSKAASYFGGYHNVDKGESSWCTSPVDSRWSNDYRQDGPLYILMANDDKGQVGEVTGLPQERYQIHFPSNQYRDRRNQTFPIAQMLNGEMSDLKDHFKEEFAKGLVTRNGDTVDVSYPDDAAGKFIGIYGFEEFFESLPSTIKKLMVNNKSDEDIALDIPQSISRFKDLAYLMLQNCVKTIPDSICQLTNLEFIGLPRNPKLVGLPACISDLADENLTFINIDGSNPNMSIPEVLASKMDEDEPGFYFMVD
jgi:hypothetical protein